jgi:hypothetical protein
MKRSGGIRGITKVRGKWKAPIKMHGRQVALGYFTVKEQAAAVYDSTARLNHVNAVCNYDSQMDADEAIREASEINVLINAGQMELIAEEYGKAKQEEAFQFIMEVLPIWRKNVAADDLRKA